MQLEKLNILYVDDDADDRQFFAEAIKETGIAYKLSTAINAMEALELMKAGNRYDVVFMDINMPLMNGFETSKRIRNLGIKTPIVALTAFDKEEIAEEAISAGINDIIVKPFDSNILFKCITNLGPKT